MPQISTKPQPARKLIDASMPKNISAEDRAKLEAEWAAAARKREMAIAAETRVPDKPSLTLRFELRRFGRHWQGYAMNGNKMTPLMPCPSLLTSAMEAVEEAMTTQALKA